jgi:hypothetical protein
MLSCLTFEMFVRPLRPGLERVVHGSEYHFTGISVSRADPVSSATASTSGSGFITLLTRLVSATAYSGCHLSNRVVNDLL